MAIVQAVKRASQHHLKDDDIPPAIILSACAGPRSLLNEQGATLP